MLVSHLPTLVPQVQEAAGAQFRARGSKQGSGGQARRMAGSSQWQAQPGSLTCHNGVPHPPGSHPTHHSPMPLPEAAQECTYIIIARLQKWDAAEAPPT